jgi:hypothetical protein
MIASTTLPAKAVSPTGKPKDFELRAITTNQKNHKQQIPAKVLLTVLINYEFFLCNLT